ncbi:hypothetical protein A0H76_1987 [Hepatospora eriocheir]|uniref:Uncharacterized protein n=1 Tax=Hepatospora eriocheir TaxID=1081669 RepID=A0A1X0QG48_9MICR|nr:hypothetical protein A0H76_1987 [Hepatospora eriocheir]
MSLNNSFHTSLGFSPYEYICKYSNFDIFGTKLDIPEYKLTSNCNKNENQKIKIGDKLLVKNTDTSKLSDKFLGPYCAIGINKYGNVVILGVIDK